MKKDVIKKILEILVAVASAFLGCLGASSI
ncbi:MAG: smalltalk protein [Duncaniella sp.]|nr:smalltalk protein [Duncaniella sp.]MDE6089292.1 smalltalk protein [Duncaniella sp.]